MPYKVGYNFGMATNLKDRRRYYRHPISVPITLHPMKEKNQAEARSIDVSLGGLCFLWPRKLPKGSLVGVNIAVKNKSFEIRSRVAYTTEDRVSGKFRTGVSFVDYPSAFMARLAEQMLEILQYKKNLSRELGYEVPEEEAANRWIENFADTFP